MLYYIINASFFYAELSLTGNCPEKRRCVSGKKTEHLFIKDGASLKKRRCVFFLANRKAAFAGYLIATAIRRNGPMMQSQIPLF